VNEVSDFVGRIRDVTGPGAHPLHEPVLGEVEIDFLSKCIRSGFVSSVGEFVTTFEEQLASFLECNAVVAMSSGTAALHIALLTMGVRPGDEVLIPSATFVATANAVAYCGAVPHFIDIEWETLGVDAHALDTHLNAVAVRKGDEVVNRNSGRRISLCVPMHTFGHAVNMSALHDVVREWGIPIVEDAAEALGSSFQNRKCGTFGLVGVFSFNGNKTITTGGGGALATNDRSIAERARHLSTTAKLKHRWDFIHDEIGFNYRMPNVNAALGCAQLTRLKESLQSKRRLFDRYDEIFKGSNLGAMFSEPPDSQSNYWLQTFILHREKSNYRDEILDRCNSDGLALRPLWAPLHTLRPFKNLPRAEMPVTMDLSLRAINLPSSAGIA